MYYSFRIIYFLLSRIANCILLIHISYSFLLITYYLPLIIHYWFWITHIIIYYLLRILLHITYSPLSVWGKSSEQVSGTCALHGGFGAEPPHSSCRHGTSQKLLTRSIREASQPRDPIELLVQYGPRIRGIGAHLLRWHLPTTHITGSIMRVDAFWKSTEGGTLHMDLDSWPKLLRH